MPNIHMSWPSSNTFHHTDFSNLDSLLCAKKSSGLTISVCIPTLNEENTIGNIVDVLTHELIEKNCLIDELVVIDSGSTDRTEAIVRERGVDFYFSGDIAPEHGFYKGKGENLWKALHQLKGDIICYIDGDIKNIHPRFVYGLVAPLIQNQALQYVKAFYERPPTITQGIPPTGGGRVTEILIRPLFSLFYPELTQLHQPLSGEYAVRRTVLESIPFPTGYGVETAHLLDAYHKWGIDIFAQTDLDEREHRHQSTHALGKMAFSILQVFLKRAKDHGKIDIKTTLPEIYRTFHTQDTQLKEIEYRMNEPERPPLNSI